MEFRLTKFKSNRWNSLRRGPEPEAGRKITGKYPVRKPGAWRLFFVKGAVTMRTTTMKPGTMNPKQHSNPAGFRNVRVSRLPAPSSQPRYCQFRVPYPSLF